MNSSQFQWVLLVGCVVAIGWQHSKIGDLQESLQAQGIATEQSVTADDGAEAPVRPAMAKPAGRGRLIALESRIARLEGSQTFRPSAAMERFGGDDSDAGRDDQTESAMAPEVEAALDTVLSNPRASEQLRDMIREEQAAAWEERRDERRERRDNRMQEEIEALNEMLELSGSDSDTMNGLMTAENDAIRGFWGQVRSGDLSWGQARKATRMRRNETDAQVRELLHDLRHHDCDRLTLGQYLQPSRNHLPVKRFVHPDEFARLAEFAEGLGFEHVASGPLVRSSYHADLQAAGHTVS